MPKLPVKYFKTVTEYVKYNWSGAIDKLYPVVKTVTKDFTRTDPVYVRIGEDGEPEIHYTMTQANGTSFFAGMDLGNAKLCLHGFEKVTSIYRLFNGSNIGKLAIDSLQSVTSFNQFFYGIKSAISSFELTDSTINATNIDGAYLMFFRQSALKQVPAIDFSAVQSFTYSFNDLTACERFLPYGMKSSFSLSSTDLKHDAILEVFNNLGKVTAGSGVTLTLGDEKKALMTTEEIKIATDKGWEVA